MRMTDATDTVGGVAVVDEEAAGDMGAVWMRGPCAVAVVVVDAGKDADAAGVTMDVLSVHGDHTPAPPMTCLSSPLPGV